jgi:hypothetical protein
MIILYSQMAWFEHITIDNGDIMQDHVFYFNVTPPHLPLRRKKNNLKRMWCEYYGRRIEHPQ